MLTTASPSTFGVCVSQLNLRYTKHSAPLFNGLNFKLAAARCTCLLGRSGCGKSSLLKVLANLLPLPKECLSGQVCASDGASLEGRVSYMAQQDLLLPWLNVLDNVGLKSKLQHGRLSPQEQQQGHALLAQLGLAHVAYALPHQLSGGMRQRVALARTLMQDAPVVLMDEPFSALDAVTRYQMQQLSASLLKHKTRLLITHDPQEALILGDDIYLMHATPAQMTPLPVPNSPTPRAVNAELGEYQAKLYAKLEAQYANCP